MFHCEINHLWNLAYRVSWRMNHELWCSGAIDFNALFFNRSKKWNSCFLRFFKVAKNEIHVFSLCVWVILIFLTSNLDASLAFLPPILYLSFLNANACPKSPYPTSQNQKKRLPKDSISEMSYNRFLNMQISVSRSKAGKLGDNIYVWGWEPKTS